MFFPLFPITQVDSSSLETPIHSQDHELSDAAKHLQKPLNTLGLIWRKNEPKKTTDGFIIASITADTPEACLDELRANDYFILKKGLVSPSTRSRLENIVQVNMKRRDKGLKSNAFEKSIESQLWEANPSTHNINLLSAKSPTDLFGRSSPAYSTPSSVFRENQLPARRFSSLISEVPTPNDGLPSKFTSTNLPNEKQSLFRSMFDNSALEASANNSQNVLKPTSKHTTSFPYQGNLFSSTSSKAFPQPSHYVLSKDAEYQELFPKTAWPANNKESHPSHDTNSSTSQLDNFLIKESSNPSKHIANFQKILYNDSNFFKPHTTPESQILSVPKPENISSIPKPEQQRTYYSFSLHESENAQHPPTENILPAFKAFSPLKTSQSPYHSNTNLNQNRDLPYSFFPSPLETRDHPTQEKEINNNIDAPRASYEKPQDQVDSIKDKSSPQVGSYSSELNKMVMIGNFMELLKDHGASFPEDILDTTDFVPKMFEFLQSYKVEMPTHQTPKYKFKKEKGSSTSTVLHVTKEKPNQVDRKSSRIEVKGDIDVKPEATLKGVSEDLDSIRLLDEEMVRDIIEVLGRSREVQSQETERMSQGPENLKVQGFEEDSNDKSSTSSTEMVTFSLEIVN